MLRNILAAALSCAVFGMVSLNACAETVQSSSEVSEESETKIEYIYSDIAEKSISAYGMYEEVLANQVAFYSNVSNGDIVEHAVTLEFPNTVSVNLEKDGNKEEFTAGEDITAAGKYSLTIMVNGNDLLGGSENEVYYGMFRFWIVEPSTDEVSVEASSEEPPVPDNETSNYEEITAESGGDAFTAETEDAGEPEVTAEAGNDGDGTSENMQLPKTDKGKHITQYLTDGGVLVITDNDTEFTCNIPAGMLTTGSVVFDLSDLGSARYIMMLNGQELTGYEYQSALSNPGDYTLFIDDGDSSDPVEFGFTILGEYAGGLTQYTVPSGCTIESAKFNGRDIRPNGNSVDIGEEGEYSFRVKCGALTFNEQFTLDNTPPEFVVNGLDEDGKADNGTVFIEFSSDDIFDYTVVRNGNTYRKTLEITEPGSYTVTVFDRAGNSTSQSFEIVYHMDVMAVVTIILGGCIIVGGAVFFIITRKRFVIR